ncbi:MAG: hypothetical protein QOF25_574 [Mycobacterium sp.]|nr:hypothetical protein [Mycobacterium sp.]
MTTTQVTGSIIRTDDARDRLTCLLRHCTQATPARISHFLLSNPSSTFRNSDGAVGCETDRVSQVVQAIAFPPARDFILSAGFAGAAAVVAGVIVLCAVLYGSRQAGKRSLAERDQRERHYAEGREAEQRAVAVARCWDQWWQVVETAALEPADSEGATLGLGPEVTLELLRGLLRDAERLGDDTLVKAVAVHHDQLLLVLAQQSGPLSTLAAPAPAASAHRGSDKTPPPDQQASSTDGPAPSGLGAEPRRRRAAAPATGAAPEPATGETPSATGEATGGRRRRR